MPKPKSLIINTPFVCPQQHWVSKQDATLEIVPERRPASYEMFDVRNNTRRTVEIELVNVIRGRVDQWREAGYPGVTIVTRRLLEHWHDNTARQHPFYFCQLEAIETLIWCIEATEEYKQGIYVPGDGGPWQRLCNKMATGAGKTTVMAMIITWQVLNALTYPKRNKDFSRAIFIVAPGLTVKGRLQVLIPSAGSYYDEFNLCPSEALRQKLNQAEILIENWHTLMPASEPKRSVVKKGAETDEAFTRRVLGKLAAFKDIVVINDEAHHAYRKPAEVKISKKQAEEAGIDLDEATRWIEGLDRLHKTRRIQRCFDLSATPFAPTGKASTDTALFEWIVSDFGLNDAIEAGLVKTPRVVVRDDAMPDAKTMRSKLYHIYRDPAVAEDLNRKAEPHEALPKLVQDAYTILGADWRVTAKDWAGHHSPPVMLTVCNRTETAARIEHYFNQGDCFWPELNAPGKTLRVDSRVMEKAEVGEAASADKGYEARLEQVIDEAAIPETKKERLRGMKKEELLREIIDNVGKRGGAGQNLQKVISVAMLSEGWDAKNVTHIMGLRAFTSQLLCEQVIGRGLRRVGYDKDENGLFLPEYVNVFGVPLSIYEPGEGGDAPPPPKPSTQIDVMPDRASLELKWPNVLRIETVVKPELAVEWAKVEPLILDPVATVISAEIAPALGGAADMSKVTAIDLSLLPEEFRLQRLTFVAARKAFAELKGNFKGNEEYLVFQLIRLVETFLRSDKIDIPSLFHSDPVRRRILIALNIDLIVRHVLRFVTEQNTTALTPVFDEENPIGSTGQMRAWYTTKPNMPTGKSHISHVVGDSAWEQYAANVFESREDVIAYAKNDHLSFQIHYLWQGSRRRYIPDFLVRLENGKTLALEIKGTDNQQNKAKREALDEWVRAINSAGGFGQWSWDVAFDPARVNDIVARHAKV
ncbi:DEAD/DEAH box helicase family protein [Novosphingobium sp. KCTC 2891]|uniref:BPTD_3080 family restriction endonuclease n=1 Tax=Novosphingobium sp. KCTC 2891 TaxID=2989730 RepID=UPI002221C1E7|nr:DEAD/DEAH box helicase family protein [Novosphingobium sp. KCTC 2891]MCW1383924.1 DEAD/DEAH box helicase family protein [Novosphingobium sp. KCTC 2891]